MKRLKVLVICGGGVFGAIPAHFLSMLPQEQQTLKDIDVIAGCSIGGILSCAYAVGHTFADVDKCFQQRAKDCFKKRWQAKINPLECPIYDSESLYEVIQDMIGNSLVRDIKKIFPQLTLVVPALNVTTDKPIFFQNITHEFEKLPLKEVAKMTSAAPSYFDCVEYNGEAVVDGGIIDVDGAMTALTTVKELTGTPFTAMDVMILGTGQDVDKNPLTVKAYRKLKLFPGMVLDVLRAYATLGNKQVSKIHLRGLGCHCLNYFNPVVIDGELDDWKQVPQLIKDTDKCREEFLRVWNAWRTC